MMRRIRAHFDGKVIVPDEPIDLPLHEPLTVQLSTVRPTNGRPSREVVAERRRRLARAVGCLSGPVIGPEALRRENLYDDAP